jgi:hypothetical protein
MEKNTVLWCVGPLHNTMLGRVPTIERQRWKHTSRLQFRPSCFYIYKLLRVAAAMKPMCGEQESTSGARKGMIKPSHVTQHTDESKGSASSTSETDAVQRGCILQQPLGGGRNLAVSSHIVRLNAKNTCLTWRHPVSNYKHTRQTDPTRMCLACGTPACDGPSTNFKLPPEFNPNPPGITGAWLDIKTHGCVCVCVTSMLDPATFTSNALGCTSSAFVC